MEEIELRAYWEIIRKRIALVLLIPFIAAMVSGALSFFVLKPEYEADTTLVVNQKTDASTMLQYQQIMAGEALTKTYSDIIKSQTLEQSVINALHLPYTIKQLDSMIKVSSPDQSLVIQIAVTDTSHQEAVKIANQLANTFKNKAAEMMNVENVQIVDPALDQANPTPVKPKKALNIAIALILGFMVSIGLAFLLEYLDNRIRTEEDVKRYLNLPVLGTIVDYESEM
jgi:capsular polysaccharide biosynthesis protein